MRCWFVELLAIRPRWRLLKVNESSVVRTRFGCIPVISTGMQKNGTPFDPLND